MIRIVILICSFSLWTTTSGQYNLFNTDKTLDAEGLAVNCLHFYSPLFTADTEKIDFCLGPLNQDKASNKNFINTRDRNFTFKELHEMHVTSDELLAWSATIDSAEQYQYYIDHLEDASSVTEILFNCTRPWFGPRCEYSFGLGTTYQFGNVVSKTEKVRDKRDVPDDINYLNCYVHLKCYRGGHSYCLDWREICDGNVDCIDDGVDEAQCFELEINECKVSEYRCHNGLCISQEFVDDDSPQCLDTSDMVKKSTLWSSFEVMLLFDHEEDHCRQGKRKFSCSDGVCVEPYREPCKTNRQLHFIESISRQGNLSRDCWTAMTCLTKIRENIDQITCDQLLNSSTILNYLQTCSDIIEFPVMPIAFGHVRFLYRPKHIHEFSHKSSLKPNYICYDHNLCDFLVPTYFYGIYSCRYTHEVISDSTLETEDWASLVYAVELYFRRCSIKQNNQNYSHHSTLYCCKNSSKCISKSRILDGIVDCYLNDDEEAFNVSCSIANSLRYDCLNENKCYSPLIQEEVCSKWRFRRLNEIQFEQICDRVVHVFPVSINGHNYTDETECDKWPCNNYYTRCNGFWNCPNGEDEENCTKPLCPARRFPCVLPHNYTMICLPAERVGDTIIDCLGALDEMDYCRRNILEPVSYFGFRCMNSTKCLARGDLCDARENCPLNDDEAFCNTFHSCQLSSIDDLASVEQAICRANHLSKAPFRLNQILQYPLLTNDITIHSHRQDKLPSRKVNFITKEPDDPAWPWRCNRGNYVRKWLGGSNFTYTCMCPANYYGDHCQFQNERVSLTLRVRAINPNSIYAIFVTLFDDDNGRLEIDSYEQFTVKNFGFCEQNFNAYLIYRTRPKNMSKNYSIRIDAFEKTSLAYISSWYFKVPFNFLPVNRIAQVLTVPVEPMAIVEECSIKCLNGECVKYVNQENVFCRCHSGWHGARCDIKLRCDDCSNDSVCIGMMNNRPICICPVNKWGSRCLLNLSCSENICFNDGRCIATMDPKHVFGYACICPIGFGSIGCEIRQYQLNINFDDANMFPYILLYRYLLDNATQLNRVSMKVVPYKLKMFQRSLSIYSSVSWKMVFAKMNNNIYLIVAHTSDLNNITTSIDAKQRCKHVQELLKPDLANLPVIRRIKYYYSLCRNHSQLVCFFDEFYMCLCSKDSQPHCFLFEHSPPKCQHNVFCQNGAECWQDDVKCPKTTICVCNDCFFGTQCQFYGKGIGLTLDDIFRYEIRPNSTINDQNNLIKSSISFTMIILVGGWINSALSFITFRSRRSKEVGAGIYLLASSMTSFLTVNIFAVKFWFLILSQIGFSVSQTVVERCCISFEFILKFCLYFDNWLNAFVAIERLITVYKGVNFDKTRSKRIAQRMLFIIPLVVATSLIHEPLYREVFDDKEENRLWCALRYSRSIHIYNTFILLFHFIGPLTCNLISAIFIIYTGVRRRARAQKQQSYKQHLRQQINEHKNLIISPIILVILSIPRLFISLLTGCLKESHNSWLYLFGYMISLLPSMSIFFVFILPSKFYMAEFKSSIKSWRRQLLSG